MTFVSIYYEIVKSLLNIKRLFIKSNEDEFMLSNNDITINYITSNNDYKEFIYSTSSDLEYLQKNLYLESKLLDNLIIIYQNSNLEIEHLDDNTIIHRELLKSDIIGKYLLSKLYHKNNFETYRKIEVFRAKDDYYYYVICHNKGESSLFHTSSRPFYDSLPTPSILYRCDQIDSLRKVLTYELEKR